jgi:hypothetical protein
MRAGLKPRRQAAAAYPHWTSRISGIIEAPKSQVAIANDAEAKKFGRKSVQVEILEYGNGGPRKKGAGGEEQAEDERP